MTRTLALLSLVVLIAAVAPPLVAQEEPIPILIIGTHNMDPERSRDDETVDDILSPKRQEELDQLAEKIAAFQPTKIAVEVPYPFLGTGQRGSGRRNPAYVDRFELYPYADADPDRNEVYQLGFRVAKKAAANAVVGIDSAMPMEFERVRKLAQLTGRAELLEESQKAAANRAGQVRQWLLSMTLPEFYQKINDPEFARSLNEPYFQYPLVVGRDQDYGGTDLVADWYKRNLRIFANVHRVADPGDRILILFGMGHIHLLRQFAKEDPTFELVDAADYL